MILAHAIIYHQRETNHVGTVNIAHRDAVTYGINLSAVTMMAGRYAVRNAESGPI